MATKWREKVSKNIVQRINGILLWLGLYLANVGFLVVDFNMGGNALLYAAAAGVILAGCALSVYFVILPDTVRVPRYFETVAAEILSGFLAYYTHLTHALLDAGGMPGLLAVCACFATYLLVFVHGVRMLILKLVRGETSVENWGVWRAKDYIGRRVTGDGVPGEGLCGEEDKKAERKRTLFAAGLCFLSAVLFAMGYMWLCHSNFLSVPYTPYDFLQGIMYNSVYFLQEIMYNSVYLLVIFPVVLFFWTLHTFRRAEKVKLRRMEELEEERQRRAERMKLELITNVSHDLRTPLTSIISYIELLEGEEMSDVAKDYVKVLADKSGRLKKMIEDVFLLSKASSGNLSVRREQVDLRKLMIQTLADMRDSIENSPVEVMAVPVCPERPAVVESDGEKLYRALQNLVENALKYARPGTVVSVLCDGGDGEPSFIRVTNEAGYEMDFSKEDIMARFARGDKARSEEGSGLGLAIAGELMEVCGGKLEISIEGNVFAATLVFAP